VRQRFLDDRIIALGAEGIDEVDPLCHRALDF
jgi:hypothetical protein